VHYFGMKIGQDQAGSVIQGHLDHDASNSESTLGKDSSVPLMCYNLSDLVSMSVASLVHFRETHVYLCHILFGKGMSR